MRVCILVGSLAISGGTYVIIQHALFLQSSGITVTLAVQESFTKETFAWHDRASSLRFISFEQGKRENYDLVIATWWKTALELGDFQAERFAYFVQSIESRFYPTEESPLRELVDSTYSLPVSYVTEASWIQQHLALKHNQHSTLVRNGIRKDLYGKDGKTLSPKKLSTPRVLVEGHFGVSFKNTALAIRLAWEAGARDIWVLTGSPVKYLPKVARVFSRVPVSEAAAIYRSCDILVKLSTVEGMFGPPLEMFHCGGTAIVFNVSGHDEYIRDGFNARVLSRNDSDGVVSVLRELLNDPSALKVLKDGAVDTASAWPSWDESSAQFLGWTKSCIEAPKQEPSTLRDFSSKAWSQYIKNEEARLAANPNIIRRRKVRYALSKMASPIRPYFKQIQAISEVLWRRRISL
jgi:hypothetical protein